MSAKKEEIHVEEEGFITTRKGLTLSSLALFIWVLTSVLYAITNELIVVNYKTFVFFVSLTLSGLAGYYITKSLVKNTDVVSRTILIIANILLLYTSANGLQTGYCFINSENPNLNHASLIPFFVAKPWLPDKFQSSKIEELENKNQSLNIRVQQLEDYSADKSELINNLKRLKEEKQNLIDSLANFFDYYKLKEDVVKLTNKAEGLEKLNTELNDQLTNLRSDYSKLKGSYGVLSDSIKELHTDFGNLQSKYNELYDKCKDIDSLKDRYKRLSQDYSRLKIGYSSLKAKHNELTRKYDKLTKIYNELKKKYDALIVVK